MGNPDDLKISREAKSHYGSLEPFIRDIRAHNPQDLNAEQWRKAHPEESHSTWRDIARNHLRRHLNFNPGRSPLNAETTDVTDRGDFVLERVTFNNTPWSRINGYLLLPKGVPQPMPGLVVNHAWGGPILWGKDRIVNSGRDHHLLAEHRELQYSGRYLAEEFAKQGYAVIVIDTHHFGERIPRGVGGIPEEFDPYETNIRENIRIDWLVRDMLYSSVRQLNWAGVTWAGINYWDDSRCVDYLVNRPEVDVERIGCTGMSVGGYRVNVLAALDERVKCAVSAGWMTTGDYQQIYSVDGVCGTFSMLPGVWNRMDVPDLPIMAAPNAFMTISNREDPLFPPEAQDEAARRIREGFAWAGVPERYEDVGLPKPHVYDRDLQEKAFQWFERHLRPGKAS
jgi:dienelactone hydrolase